VCPRLCPPHLYTENAGTFSAPGAPGRTRLRVASAWQARFSPDLPLCRSKAAESGLPLGPGRYLPAPTCLPCRTRHRQGLRQAGGMRLPPSRKATADKNDESGVYRGDNVRSPKPRGAAHESRPQPPRCSGRVGTGHTPAFGNRITLSSIPMARQSNFMLVLYIRQDAPGRGPQERLKTPDLPSEIGTYSFCRKAKMNQQCIASCSVLLLLFTDANSITNRTIQVLLL
jgi:hypothetical protein